MKALQGFVLASLVLVNAVGCGFIGDNGKPSRPIRIQPSSTTEAPSLTQPVRRSSSRQAPKEEVWSVLSTHSNLDGPDIAIYIPGTAAAIQWKTKATAGAVCAFRLSRRQPDGTWEVLIDQETSTKGRNQGIAYTRGNSQCTLLVETQEAFAIKINQLKWGAENVPCELAGPEVSEEMVIAATEARRRTARDYSGPGTQGPPGVSSTSPADPYREVHEQSFRWTCKNCGKSGTRWHTGFRCPVCGVLVPAPYSPLGPGPYGGSTLVPENDPYVPLTTCLDSRMRAHSGCIRTGTTYVKRGSPELTGSFCNIHAVRNRRGN